jgi:hypothetical protein
MDGVNKYISWHQRDWRVSSVMRSATLLPQLSPPDLILFYFLAVGLMSSCGCSTAVETLAEIY